MSKIILDYSTEAQFRAAVASAPKNLVERGDTLELVQTKAEIFFDAPVVLTGFTTGPSNGILMSCALNASYVENPDVLTLPFAYSATAGAAWRIHGSTRPPMLTIDVPYVTMKGMQLQQAAGDTQRLLQLNGTANDFVSLHSIFDSHGQLAYCWPVSIDAPNVKFMSSLIIHRSNRENAIYMNGFNAEFENCTIVRPTNFNTVGAAFQMVRGGAKIQNCVGTGFYSLTDTQYATGDNNACDGSIQFGNNKLENISVPNTWVSSLNDFRTKAGASIIDSGAVPSSKNVAAPSGVRQQGTAADRGAWEYPSTLVAPTATVTGVQVAGRKVTITGTTTGTPTSGVITMTKEAVDNNSAVAQGPKNLVFGAGTFSCEFTDAMYGAYNLKLSVSNAAYTVNGTNPVGSFLVEGPKASNIVQTLDGQRYRINAVTTGNPTAGTVLLPADKTNPDGATDRLMNLVITANACSLEEFIPVAGNYGPGILTLSNAGGTSLPQPGTSAISIKGISGNPQIPDMEQVVVPKVTAVDVTPAVGTIEAEGTIQLNASVVGENYPGQAVAWSTPKGTVSSNGLFKGHAPTVDEVVVVTATSIADPSFSDTAVIKVKAKVVVVVPDPDPEPEDPDPTDPEVPVVVKATKATIEMISPEGVTQANLTGLSVSFFDQTDIGDLLAPVARTKVGSTNAQGQLVMNITGTNLVPGQSGRIVVGKGTKAFTGIVVVS
jgi:hypothetical protein